MCVEGHVKIRSTNVPVPLWNLILEYHMVTKRIPRVTASLAVILMRIIVPMCKNYIWLYSGLHFFEISLQLGGLCRKIPVSKGMQLDSAAFSSREKISGGCPCLALTRSNRGQDAPHDVKLDAFV